MLIIKDYIVPSRRKKTPEKVMNGLQELDYEELLKQSTIAKLLGYENFEKYDENLVSSFKSFQHILAADIEDLDEVDGIGEIRAKTIKQSLKRMQEQFIFDNLI